jgi:ribosomal protein L9
VATPAKVAEVERRESRRARHEASTNDEANRVKQVLEATELRFDVAAGETGTLFGSVTPTDIADELWSSKKIRVDRRKIHLPETIKRVGWYTIPIEVFSGVVAEMQTVVVPVGGEVPPKEAPAPEPEPEAEATPEPEAEAAPEAVAARASESQAEPAPEPEAVAAPEAPEPVLDPVERTVAEPESPAAEAPVEDEPAVTEPEDEAPAEPIA